MDRNNVSTNYHIRVSKSLSARRAWIEIIARFKRERKGLVALRKESVDRNVSVAQTALKTGCRSPQGERG